MKRRKFGLLSGSALAAAAAPQIGRAQSATPDASLLSTTLTPFGAERAGNADGSIPAWTGGLITPPLAVNQPVDVQLFTDEQPLYTVDASNMAQYEALLTEGTKALMTKVGFKIKVYQTHRTAAAPQYVYDNMVKNVTRAKLEPAGGRFGFTGAYGGAPFPILDTSDPLIAGTQLIWNDLISWGAYSYWTKFSAGFVVTGGRVINTYGGSTDFLCPYFDPNGSPETYDGYYSKLHSIMKTPPGSDGEEAMVWHTSNTLVKPDITWSVVNGQGRVRKAPDEAYDTPNPTQNGIGNYDDQSGFGGSPQKYDWKLVEKREMIVPYHNNAIHFSLWSDLMQPGFPNADIVRWEKHRVYVLEATLHPGERNTSARRTMYLDEDTYFVLISDCYDADNNLVKTNTVYTRCVPSLPGYIEQGYATWDMASGDYSYIGPLHFPPYSPDEFFGPQSPEIFDPQQMAASASF